MNHDQQHDDAAAAKSPASESPASATATAKHRKRRRLFWSIVAFLVIVALGLAVTHRAKRQVDANTSAQPSAANVSVATATRGDIGLYVEALGTVTPIATVTLYTQITGRVVAVHYREGQMVHKGDALIDIDPQPYEAQLLEAQGTLERDRGLLAEAQIDLARYKDASANNAISRQTYEDQEQVVVQYKGTVKNDLGQVQYAQAQLSYCHIAAPISGRLGLRLVDAGNTVFSGTSNALAVITQLQPITVVFNVAEDNLDRVHDLIERRSDLAVDAYDRAQVNKIASGTLLTLDNQIDTTTGTVRFRGQFDNADLKLYPNQFVNARLLTQTVKDATLVPSSAVQHNGVDAFVYRIGGGKAKVQAVREVTTEGDTTAVDGIRPGDVVAVSGFDKLQDGSPVSVDAQPGGHAQTRGQAPRGGTSQQSGSSQQGGSPR